MHPLVQKALSLAALAITAKGGSKVTEVAWRLVTGKNAPTGEDDDASLLSMALFAAVSAGVVAVTQHYVMRSAKRLSPMPEDSKPSITQS